MAKTYELVMPGTYFDMDSVEREYDAGGFWNKICNALAVVGIVALVVAVGFLSGGLALGIGLAGAAALGGGLFGGYKTGKIGFGDASISTVQDSLSNYCNYDSTLGSGSGQ